MDLLKEKYSELLNEDEDVRGPYCVDQKMYIDGEERPIFFKMKKLPKFLKHVEVHKLSLYNLRLENLENCPKTDNLYLDSLSNLRTLEGMNTAHVELYDLPKIKNLNGIQAKSINFYGGRGRLQLNTFEGLPEELDILHLGSEPLSRLFLECIKNGTYKPKKIWELKLGFYWNDVFYHMRGVVKSIPNFQSIVDNIEFNRVTTDK